MRKQPEESPTPYAGMITKQMGEIDFHKVCNRAGKAGTRIESLAQVLITFCEWQDIEGTGKVSRQKMTDASGLEHRNCTVRHR